MQTKSVSIVIADDHRMIRESLIELIEKQPNHTVVGQAADGHQALKLIGELEPDVLIVDISMPGLNGIATVERLKEIPQSPRVLVLTMHEEQEYVLHLVKSGAHGYVLKDAPAEELLRAIATVAEGKTFYGEHAATALAEQYRHPHAEAGNPYRSLTNREKQVFHQIVEGLTTKEIASKLEISVKTAENHRGHILEKLECRNVAELVRYAAQKKLL